jgi:putative membrane protein
MRAAIMDEPSYTTEDLILRDHLALDRTQLANERTLLSYLRTALMLAVAGATAVKFVGESPTVIVSGWLFIGLGIVVGAIGAWRFLTMQRDINARRGPAPRS